MLLDPKLSSRGKQKLKKKKKKNRPHACKKRELLNESHPIDFSNNNPAFA